MALICVPVNALPCVVVKDWMSVTLIPGSAVVASAGRPVTESAAKLVVVKPVTCVLVSAL